MWLPSGGSLVIDRTEAMTVVDVNTGKFTGQGGNLEETVTRNNLEAAEEIVRQLRLRDVGGIVVIDFIDMVLESNRELVLRRLLECLARDRTKHQVAEVTSLGLVQMTRKRVGPACWRRSPRRANAATGAACTCRWTSPTSASPGRAASRAVRGAATPTAGAAGAAAAVTASRTTTQAAAAAAATRAGGSGNGGGGRKGRSGDSRRRSGQAAAPSDEAAAPSVAPADVSAPACRPGGCERGPGPDVGPGECRPGGCQCRPGGCRGCQRPGGCERGPGGCRRGRGGCEPERRACGRRPG